MAGVMCPFCGEDNLNQVTLKYHLLNGYCDIFKRIDEDHNSEIDGFSNGEYTRQIYEKRGYKQKYINKLTRRVE